MRVASSETNQRSCETKITVPSKELQGLDQRAIALQVEVVGGLVEHQHVGPLHHQPQKISARPRRRRACRPLV
jgi:hypothetical protein